MKTGIIYKATSPSGKVYIGQTIRTIHKRKIAHYSGAFNKNSTSYNCAISKAIRKYNNNIVWEILHYDVSICKLDVLEIEEIKKHNSFKLGYNSTLGGGGGCVGYTHSVESLKKISDSSKRKPSLESRKKMSASQKNKKPLSLETRKKISENNKQSKLNPKKAEKIRVKYATKKYTQRELAKEYGVSLCAISNVINYKTYQLHLIK